MQRTIQAVCSVKEADMPADGKQFMEQYLPYGEVGVLDNMEAIASAFLAGITCLFIDGYAQCMIMDCRDVYKRQVYVDLDDEGNGSYRRIPKKSFSWYKKVIASNGSDLD